MTQPEMLRRLVGQPSIITEAQADTLNQLVEAVEKWSQSESRWENTPEEDAIIDALWAYYRTVLSDASLIGGDAAATN